MVCLLSLFGSLVDNIILPNSKNFRNLIRPKLLWFAWKLHYSSCPNFSTLLPSDTLFLFKMEKLNWFQSVPSLSHSYKDGILMIVSFVLYPKLTGLYFLGFLANSHNFPHCKPNQPSDFSLMVFTNYTMCLAML